MKNVALQFTYHTDVVEVPDDIIAQIKKVQRSFDKWLYDKSNDHGCWVMIDGQKRAVSFDSSDFVSYINTFLLADRDCKARIVQKDLPTPPAHMPLIYF